MRRIGVLVGALAVVVAGAVVVFGGGAGAASTTVQIQGSETFVPNGKIEATYHFSPGAISVRPGTSATWVDATDSPHTITIVKPGQVPANINQVFNCKVCQSQNPSANVGAPGLDAPGDSLLVRSGSSVTSAVTAPRGTTLHYICVFHPWMQGTITVS